MIPFLVLLLCFFLFLKFYFLVSLISTEVEQKQLKVKIVVVSAE